MILAACEGRGNGEKDAEGLARAESREGSLRWGGWTGRKGGMGRSGWQWGGGDREGESGRGQWLGEDGEGATGTGRGWQWRRGQWGRGGKMGRGKQEGGKGERGEEGHGEEGARGGEISQMDMMGCLGGHRL